MTDNGQNPTCGVGGMRPQTSSASASRALAGYASSYKRRNGFSIGRTSTPAKPASRA
jgi:hypothetical protein